MNLMGPFWWQKIVRLTNGITFNDLTHKLEEQLGSFNWGVFDVCVVLMCFSSAWCADAEIAISIQVIVNK